MDNVQMLTLVTKWLVTTTVIGSQSLLHLSYTALNCPEATVPQQHSAS